MELYTCLRRRSFLALTCDPAARPQVVAPVVDKVGTAPPFGPSDARRRCVRPGSTACRSVSGSRSHRPPHLSRRVAGWPFHHPSGRPVVGGQLDRMVHVLGVRPRAPRPRTVPAAALLPGPPAFGGSIARSVSPTTASSRISRIVRHTTCWNTPTPSTAACLGCPGSCSGGPPTTTSLSTRYCGGTPSPARSRDHPRSGGAVGRPRISARCVTGSSPACAVGALQPEGSSEEPDAPCRGRTGSLR